MNILIPARGGSKRIPNKNLQLINDKSLLQITIEHAKNFGTPFVSSDSDEILKCANQYGANCIKRPAELCQDDTPTLPIWQDFARKYTDKDGYTILMQCTSPIRDIQSLSLGLKEMIYKGYVSGFSAVVFGGFVHKLHHSGYLERCFERIRTQDIQTKFVIEDGSMYVAKSDELLRAKDLFFGWNPYILKNDIVVDIDNYEDLELARRIIPK